jgi:glycosyltransferase involved in cell wall biosynthesis
LGFGEEAVSDETDRIALVVPCYNEEQRLDGSAFVALVDKDPGLSLLFVDDGSTDGTARLHARLAAERPVRIQAYSLAKNQGKGEAVRQGLLHALQGSATVVGYVDADLATPASEIQRLCAILRSREDCDVLLASRIRLMGRFIDRRPLRHYLGRAFATAASWVLRLPVYDTQCGAKLFRRTPSLARALEERFLSRWIFDVELLGRLLAGAPGVDPLVPERVHEEPLQRWTDLRGSKLGTAQMLVAIADLSCVGVDLAKRRRRGS